MSEQPLEAADAPCDYCGKGVMEGERVLVLRRNAANTANEQVSCHPDCYEFKKAMR